MNEEIIDPKKLYAELFRWKGVVVAQLMPATSGKRNQWKRDTKNTHKRRESKNLPPYWGSDRQLRRSANKLVTARNSNPSYSASSYPLVLSKHRRIHSVLPLIGTHAQRLQTTLSYPESERSKSPLG